MDMTQRFLFLSLAFKLLLLRYGALEAIGLKNEMSGGNAMEKEPGCEYCACGF